MTHLPLIGQFYKANLVGIMTNFLSIVTLQMLVQVTICKTIVQIIMREKNYLQFEMAKENESKNEKVREITISVNGDELSKMFNKILEVASMICVFITISILLTKIQKRTSR